MKVKFLAAIVFLAPLLTYVWQNSSPVQVRFLEWQYPVSQAILLLATLLVGVVMGLLLSHAWRNKAKMKQKKADKVAKKQKKADAKLSKQQVQEPSNPVKAAETNSSSNLEPEAKIESDDSFNS